MAFEEYLADKKGFIFELDNVLYPEKDYLLQVYYLFAQFMEYTEQADAAAILEHMKARYESQGAENLFDDLVVAFPVTAAYRGNYERLHQNARLPLKLLMYEVLLKFLQDIVVERKQIILYTQGDAMQQLNKIKQIEWQGLENYMTVYFAEEIGEKPGVKGIDLITGRHELGPDELLMIGATETDRLCAAGAGINYLQVDKLFLP
jgi:phosphoglycolate phosphatase-like HAD superfamily hydrolase